MVVLLDGQLIDKFQLGDEGSPPELLLIIEIWDITDHEIPAVDGEGMALLHQPPQIMVMIDQLVKH